MKIHPVNLICFNKTTLSSINKRNKSFATESVSMQNKKDSGLSFKGIIKIHHTGKRWHNWYNYRYHWCYGYRYEPFDTLDNPKTYGISEEDGIIELNTDNIDSVSVPSDENDYLQDEFKNIFQPPAGMRITDGCDNNIQIDTHHSIPYQALKDAYNKARESNTVTVNLYTADFYIKALLDALSLGDINKAEEITDEIRAVGYTDKIPYYSNQNTIDAICNTIEKLSPDKKTKLTEINSFVVNEETSCFQPWINQLMQSLNPEQKASIYYQLLINRPENKIIDYKYKSGLLKYLTEDVEVFKEFLLYPDKKNENKPTLYSVINKYFDSSVYRGQLPYKEFFGAYGNLLNKIEADEIYVSPDELSVILDPISDKDGNGRKFKTTYWDKFSPLKKAIIEKMHISDV